MGHWETRSIHKTNVRRRKPSPFLGLDTLRSSTETYKQENFVLLAQCTCRPVMRKVALNYCNVTHKGIIVMEYKNRFVLNTQHISCLTAVRDRGCSRVEYCYVVA
jgi:hypothetical protein